MQRPKHQSRAESPQDFPSHKELRAAISRSLLLPGTVHVLTGPVGAGMSSLVDALPTSVAKSAVESEPNASELRRILLFRYRQSEQPTVPAAFCSGETGPGLIEWETQGETLAKLGIQSSEIFLPRLQEHLGSPLHWRRAGMDLDTRAEHFVLVAEAAFSGQVDDGGAEDHCDERRLPDHDDLWRNILALANEFRWSILVCDRIDIYYCPPMPMSTVGLDNEASISYYRMGLLSGDEAVELVRERLVGRYPEQVISRVRHELADGLVERFGRYYEFLDSALTLMRERLQANSELLRSHGPDEELLGSMLERIEKWKNDPVLRALPAWIYRDLSPLEKSYMAALSVAEEYSLQRVDTFRDWAREVKDGSLERRIATNLEVHRLLIEERAGQKSNVSRHFRSYVLTQKEAKVFMRNLDQSKAADFAFDQRTFLDRWIWGGVGFSLFLLVYLLLDFDALVQLAGLGRESVGDLRRFCRIAMIISPFAPPLIYIIAPLVIYRVRQLFSQGDR